MSRVLGVTVAIDVDGVLCPFVDPLDALRHERETGWKYSHLPRVKDGVTVADPLVQTLSELVVAGAEGQGGNEVRDQVPRRVFWHSSWWLSAAELLAPALGLSGMSGGVERMFATEAELLGKPSSITSARWWKLAAIERWLHEHSITSAGEHELLIWIDDDINDAIASGEISTELQNDPRLVMISPGIHIGINPEELALLRGLTGLAG